jgi:hypothetical protein
MLETKYLISWLSPNIAPFQALTHQARLPVAAQIYHSSKTIIKAEIQETP